MYSDSPLFVVLSQTDNFVSKGPPQYLYERPPVWSGVYSGFFPNFEVSFCQLLAIKNLSIRLRSIYQVFVGLTVTFLTIRSPL